MPSTGAIFAINLPIGGIGLVLAVWLLAPDSQTKRSEAESGRFDILGLVLSIAGFTALIYGLIQAGTDGWTDATALTALGVGIALLLILILVEYRTRVPVLDVRLFRTRTFALANILLWVVVAAYYGTLFLIPFYFETVQGISPLTAGEIMIGQGVAAAIAIAVAGELYN